MDCKIEDVVLDLRAVPGGLPAPAQQPVPSRAETISPRSQHVTPIGSFRSLGGASKGVLLASASQAITAAVFAASQFKQGGADPLLQDLVLILTTAVLALALLLDAFARENAYQLLAALGVNCVLGCSQQAVFLATSQGRSSGGVAAGAVCLALQVGAAALARPAYRGFGWRMYSHIASSWRLRPAEQQRRRERQLSVHRFAALAKLDALLLALLLVVAGVNAANPGASAAAGQPSTVWLLVASAAVGAPLLAGWLGACWACTMRPGDTWRWLPGAVDLLRPLCYVPPLLVVFAGASKGSELAQPHAQAYLIVWPVMFLAARTATWWAARQLSSRQQDQQQQGGTRQQLQGSTDGCTPGCGGSLGDEHSEPALPSELLPLLRGAWLHKLPSPEAACDAAGGEKSCSSLVVQPSAAVSCPGGGGCAECASDVVLGCGGGATCPHPLSRPRRRFFQLSQDGAALRWSWDRWILMPHVQTVHCCDETLTIRLALLLEPDLRLRCSSRQQYQEWARGLRQLLALLLQPDQRLQRRSAPAAYSSGGDGSVGGTGGMPSCSAGREAAISALASGAGSTWPAAAPAAQAVTTAPAKGRLCSQSSSQQHLAAAAARSQAALAAAAAGTSPAAQQQQQQSADICKQQPLRRTATISIVASTSFTAFHDLEPFTPFNLSNSREGAPEPAAASQQQQQHAMQAQRQRPWQRLRLGLQKALGSTFGLAGTGAAAAAGGRSGPALGARGSPTRQPLRPGGPLHASSSKGDLELAGAAVTDQEAASGVNPRSAGGVAEPAQQPQHGRAPAHHERVPTLGAWTGLPSPPSSLVPSLDLGSLAGAGGRSPGGGHHTARSDSCLALHPCPTLASGLGEGTELGVPPRQTPRVVLQGPFAHLQAALPEAPAPAAPCQPDDSTTQPGTREAHRQDSLPTTDPSIVGSEASTPAHPSSAGSPLRGSPNRQQQLQQFSLYLQQQLQLQQRGRGLLAADSGGGRDTASAPASEARSPSRSPPGAASSSAAAAAGASGAAAGPGLARAAASGMPASHRACGSRLAQQQQQFTARMQGAGTGSRGSPQQDSEGGWARPASVDGGSAPNSGLPGMFEGTGHPLMRAESTFSSWGLPTPTTANGTVRTPFNGLSRFNSLAPSMAPTPLATFRQHPAFAYSHTLPSSNVHPALMAQHPGQHFWQPAAATGGTSWVSAHGAEFAGAVEHHSSRRHTFAAAGSESMRHAGEGEEADGECGAHSGAPASPDKLSSISVPSSLGIAVPVEMVQYTDLVFGKLLGEGAEGAVYGALVRETPVAVKRTRSLMEVEMNLHAGSHDNIVQLRGLCCHGHDMYLILELCPRGTLDVLIHKGHLQHAGSASSAAGGGAAPSGGHRLDPAKLLPIVRSVARGMLHLHTRKIFHRDLKPGNLFLGHGGVVKIGDFGMSRYAAAWKREEGPGMLERTLTPGVIGTAAYSAPELLSPDTPTDADQQAAADDAERILKADVFAFGVTLWEILERKRPFAGMDGFQIQTQWYLNPEAMRLPRPTIPESTPPASRHILETLAGLVESCTQWDPDARPTFQQILATLRTCCAPGAGAAPATAPGSLPSLAEAAAPPTPAGPMAGPLA